MHPCRLSKEGRRKILTSSIHSTIILVRFTKTHISLLNPAANREPESLGKRLVRDKANRPKQTSASPRTHWRRGQPFGSHADPELTHQLLAASSQQGSNDAVEAESTKSVEEQARQQGHVDSRFGWSSERVEFRGVAEEEYRRDPVVSRSMRSLIYQKNNRCGGPHPPHEMISAMQKRRPAIRRPTSCRIGGGRLPHAAAAGRETWSDRELSELQGRQMDLRPV